MNRITFAQAAKDAMLVQSACNLSGVLHSFTMALEAVSCAMRDQGEGTEWRNNHPIVRLYVDKLASLCQMQGDSTLEFAQAWAACERIATAEPLAAVEFAPND